VMISTRAGVGAAPNPVNGSSIALSSILPLTKKQLDCKRSARHHRVTGAAGHQPPYLVSNGYFRR
jgi:hypothetical protein